VFKWPQKSRCFLPHLSCCVPLLWSHPEEQTNGRWNRKPLRTLSLTLAAGSPPRVVNISMSCSCLMCSLSHSVLICMVCTQQIVQSAVPWSWAMVTYDWSFPLVGLVRTDGSVMCSSKAQRSRNLRSANYQITKQCDQCKKTRLTLGGHDCSGPGAPLKWHTVPSSWNQIQPTAKRNHRSRGTVVFFLEFLIPQPSVPLFLK
jgi:hypothetical protein